MSVAELEQVAVKENMYEGMFLVGSTQYANDPEATTEAIMSILERAGATVLAHRPWQDGKLAYEIEGHRKGLHYLVCFTMPPAGMDVITRQCHLSDVIVRQLVIKHVPALFNALVDALNGVGEPEAEEAPAEAPKPTEGEGKA